ncbi:hypothetical protein BDZ89DRAFT_1143516 [Hymenopellis radicata]|nr:hypothetical protein BDZ89DRAFT_1143516 [Hymenopellis radicata]
MASRPSTEPDNAVQQSRPALLGLLRTRSKSRSHKRGISTPEPPSPVHSYHLLPVVVVADKTRFGEFGGRRPTQRIRLVPHLDTRRAYSFGIVVRNLRPGDPPVVMGRFEGQAVGTASAADNANSTTTTGKIAFKSKIVSRAHAELWMDNGGSIMVRDTKSASGTFLNRSRLSQVDTESKWFPLADGDILQLGVDYQGGLEDAYKAVKIRVEIGREPETAFDLSALRALNALAKSESQPSTESKKPIIPDCCICLCGISVRQALFTTPCCHTFHFKCIRPLIDAVPKTPMLTCPVCRTESNLDEEIEDHEPRRMQDIEDRLPPTPNEEERGRPMSRVLPSPGSEGWGREMDSMARDSHFIVARNNPVHPPEASPSIPIAHARAPSIPVAPLRPVARAPSAGRARTPAEGGLLSRARSMGSRPSHGLPSNPASSRPGRARPPRADALPVGAAVPLIPAIHAPPPLASPPPREPSPLPPSPPTAGGNWLREMELMQRHSQYIVTKPETKSSKDKEKEKEKSDELNRSTSLRRKGTWTRLLRAQNANPPEGSF